MDTSRTDSSVRVGLHVHIFLWVGLILVSTVPFFWLSGRWYDADHFEAGLSSCLAMIVLFQVLFWFARRRCDTEALSAWDGLLLITAYMSIGLGSLYAFIAILAGALAAPLMVLIAVWSLVRGGKVGAAHHFRRMVAWFGRHRMYQ